MLIFKDYIVGLLPGDIINRDSYKDVDGKGFIQRYLEIFGEEIDDYFYSKVTDLENELSPLSITHPDYLDYFATAMGDLPRYLANDQDFARVLTFMLSIYRAKGTIKSIKAILYSLGFTNITITETATGSGIYDDDPLTKYDEGLLYDDGCNSCSGFSIAITTSLPLTGKLYQNIKDLVELVRPLNAPLELITFNGAELGDAIFIEIEIDLDGNLVYNNDNDPELILTIVNGDLIINGPNALKYFLDENGDLYYIN